MGGLEAGAVINLRKEGGDGKMDRARPGLGAQKAVDYLLHLLQDLFNNLYDN